VRTLGLPPGANVVCVYGGDDVEEPGNDDEAGAPVGYRELDRVCSEAHCSADKIEQTAAEIAEKAEDLKDVVCVGVELSLHGKADGEHADDRDGEQRSATPFAEQEMSRSGDEPTCYERKEYKATLNALWRSGSLVLSFCHSFLTISQRAG